MRLDVRSSPAGALLHSRTDASNAQESVASSRLAVTATGRLPASVAVAVRRALVNFRDTLLRRVIPANETQHQRHTSLLLSTGALQRLGQSQARRCSLPPGRMMGANPTPQTSQAQRSVSASTSVTLCFANVRASTFRVMGFLSSLNCCVCWSRQSMRMRIWG